MLSSAPRPAPSAGRAPKASCLENREIHPKNRSRKGAPDTSKFSCQTRVSKKLESSVGSGFGSFAVESMIKHHADENLWDHGKRIQWSKPRHTGPFEPRTTSRPKAIGLHVNGAVAEEDVEPLPRRLELDVQLNWQENLETHCKLIQMGKRMI